MYFNEIKLMKRKNLGNYEHKEVVVSLALSEGEDEKVALQKADAFIAHALGQVVVTKEDAPKVEAKAPAKKKVAKKATKKAAPKVEEEPTITKDELNAKLIEVAKFYKSKEKAVALIQEVGGVDSISDLPEDKWNTLANMCKVVLDA